MSCGRWGSLKLGLVIACGPAWGVAPPRRWWSERSRPWFAWSARCGRPARCMSRTDTRSTWPPREDEFRDLCPGGGDRGGSNGRRTKGERMSITVTEKAASKVKEIVQAGQTDGSLPKDKLYLRLRVVG